MSRVISHTQEKNNAAQKVGNQLSARILVFPYSTVCRLTRCVVPGCLQVAQTDLVVPTDNGDRYQVRASHISARLGSGKLVCGVAGNMGWVRVKGSRSRER